MDRSLKDAAAFQHRFPAHFFSFPFFPSIIIISFSFHHHLLFKSFSSTGVNEWNFFRLFLPVPLLPSHPTPTPSRFQTHSLINGSVTFFESSETIVERCSISGSVKNPQNMKNKTSQHLLRIPTADAPPPPLPLREMRPVVETAHPGHHLKTDRSGLGSFVHYLRRKLNVLFHDGVIWPIERCSIGGA